MINTYQTSLAPPPVPPRLGASQPVLIPAPLPSRGHSKSLVRFLLGVVMLHLFLSVAGFLYLYHNDKMLSSQHPSGKENFAFISAEKKETSDKALARMVVTQNLHKSTQTSELGYFQWDMSHSILRNIRPYYSSWLTILQPGDYYVYSRVTFSKGDSTRALVSTVKLRDNETGKEKVVMQAYCNLNVNNPSIPQLCTATQGELITLERGNQLSLWVQDLSLVNYEDGATTFGMYKL
ncbi:CD40 ligand [Etheostoma cragini]|uniref:CD40 ligand n=1 Tax=Etheostoma cragini TaxID=417921 RepID=UPI00155F1EDE|nr:CD40 ligand [Etheostoma cragini]